MSDPIDRDSLPEVQRKAIEKLERSMGEKALRITSSPRYLRGYYYFKSDGDVMCHFDDLRVILNREGEMMLTFPKMFV